MFSHQERRAIPGKGIQDRIPGFKTLDQVRENIQAMDFGLLTDDQMSKLDEIFERSPLN